MPPRRTSLPRTGNLRARSPKTARLYVERCRLVADLLAERPWCEVPWCEDRSTAVHEPLTRARGGDILDRDNCRCVCDPHHAEIHTEAPWVYALGFLVHSWDGRRAS
ncbi:MAG TPA: hypothetical protein VNJ48_01470 [Nocardioides sp.]|nr:hypothetical protein [Nocardioides sp.]